MTAIAQRRPRGRSIRSRLIQLTLLIGLAVYATPAAGQAIDYERQVEVAPTEESIGEGYQTPEVQRPLPRAAIWHTLDVLLLAVALGLAAWLAIWRVITDTCRLTPSCFPAARRL